MSRDRPARRAAHQQGAHKEERADAGAWVRGNLRHQPARIAVPHLDHARPGARARDVPRAHRDGRQLSRNTQSATAAAAERGAAEAGAAGATGGGAARARGQHQHAAPRVARLVVHAKQNLSRQRLRGCRRIAQGQRRRGARGANEHAARLSVSEESHAAADGHRAGARVVWVEHRARHLWLRPPVGSSQRAPAATPRNRARVAFQQAAQTRTDSAYAAQRLRRVDVAQQQLQLVVAQPEDPSGRARGRHQGLAQCAARDALYAARTIESSGLCSFADVSVAFRDTSASEHRPSSRAGFTQPRRESPTSSRSALGRQRHAGRTNAIDATQQQQ
eukprot:scaffold20143_cov118-Isochrysis_galbana.AAC.3